MNIESEFAQAVTEHKGSIYTVCYMFSNDAEEINDLYQEVLINLWRGFEKFRGDSKLSTWIYRVSLNTCISYDRMRKRRPDTVPLSVEMNLYQDTDSDSRQIAALYRRINRLGKMDKALVLLWLENMSYEEIGAIMGLSAGNVSVRLVRIKEELKKMCDQ